MKHGGQTIVIRKKKGGHGGHHGGAWKVAYADFVTAMMAFFLVMWLVGQSPDVKKSIAGYFRDPGVFDFEHSTSMIPGGTPGMDPGGTPSVTPPNSDELKAEEDLLRQMAEHVRQKLAEMPNLTELRDQIELRITSEGLRIELVEQQGSSFFDSGSAALLGESERILSVIAKELSQLQNEVVVEGHTDSRSYNNGGAYTNWELSADRANAARRVMERAGLNVGQVRGVRGFADTQLRVPDAPLDPRNRRISIIVRSQAATRVEQALRDGQAVSGPK
jgi:chemotaxis protein MotB